MNITFDSKTNHASSYAQIDILSTYTNVKVGEITRQRDEKGNWFFRVLDSGLHGKRGPIAHMDITTLNHAKAVAEYHFNALEYA